MVPLCFPWFVRLSSLIPYLVTFYCILLVICLVGGVFSFASFVLFPQHVSVVFPPDSIPHVISWTSSFFGPLLGLEFCIWVCNLLATQYYMMTIMDPWTSDISLVEQFLHCENVRLQKTLSDMCPENPRLVELLHTWLRDVVIVTIRPLTASVLNSTPLQSAGFLPEVSSC